MRVTYRTWCSCGAWFRTQRELAMHIFAKSVVAMQTDPATPADIGHREEGRLRG